MCDRNGKLFPRLTFPLHSLTQSHQKNSHLATTLRPSSTPSRTPPWATEVRRSFFFCLFLLFLSSPPLRPRKPYSSPLFLSFLLSPALRLSLSLNPLYPAPFFSSSRPGPPRRLLPRLHGHPRPPRLGLRHPLQVRHVQAGPRRPGAPAGAARHLADRRQPVGGPPRRRRRQRRLLRLRGLEVGQVEPRGGGAGAGVRHADPGLRDQDDGQPEALGGAARAGRARPRRLQRGALRRRGLGGAQGLGDLGGPLPERRHRGGQGAEAQAAVLLRLGVAAGRAVEARGGCVVVVAVAVRGRGWLLVVGGEKKMDLDLFSKNKLTLYFPFSFLSFLSPRSRSLFPLPFSYSTKQNKTKQRARAGTRSRRRPSSR